MVNRGRAFANARGAAGVVPTQIVFQGGFSRNLSAALVYGQANTGTTSTSALVDFSGIANYGAVPESSIVGDGYISLMAGGEMYLFDKNGITLPNSMSIVNSLNGAVILGSGWGTTGTGSVSIGSGTGQPGDYSVAIGYGAGTNSSDYSVAIGNSSGENQSTGSVAVGYFAGNQQSEFAVAIGNGAGENQSTGSVAIGSGAGNQQGIGSVAVGMAAGTIHQDANSVSIGSSAGNIAQGAQAVAIGHLAGYAGQQNNAVAIGDYAGAGFVYASADYVSTGSTSTTLMISITSGTIVAGMKLYQGLAFSNQTVVTVNSATQITLSAPPDSTPGVGPIGFILGQGNHSIAIGTYAGYYSAMEDAQENNTIILNATGTPLIGVNSQTNSLYVAPIRSASGTGGVLQYNTTTNEVTYSQIINADRLTLASATASTSTTTGALTVAGGVGIRGNLYVANTSYINNAQIITTATLNLYASNTIITAGTDTAINTSTGNVTIWNTSTLQTVTGRGATTDRAITISNNSASNSTLTGALQVSGGVGVGGNLYVGGVITATNVYVGTYAVSTASALTIQFNGSQLGTANTLNFSSGTTVTLSSSVLTIRATATGSSTGQFTPNVYTTSSTSTAVIDVTNIDQYNITSLAADVTFSVTSTVTPDDGQRLLIRIRSDATPRNLTWTDTANQFRTIGISFPTITSASKLVYIGFVYNAVDGYWDLISSLQQP